MPKVSSSNISKIEYDSKKKTLTVTFHSGSAYEYADVPESTYKAFLRAPSKGRYLHANIKNQYDVNRIS